MEQILRIIYNKKMDIISLFAILISIISLALNWQANKTTRDAIRTEEINRIIDNICKNWGSNAHKSAIAEWEIHKDTGFSLQDFEKIWIAVHWRRRQVPLLNHLRKY